MKPIYTITLIPQQESGPQRPRTVGFFHTPEEARRVPEKNEGELDEGGYYQYLVIEQVNPGLHPATLVVQWYIWNTQTKSWTLWFTPEKHSFVTNFGIG